MPTPKTDLGTVLSKVEEFKKQWNENLSTHTNSHGGCLPTD